MPKLRVSPEEERKRTILSQISQKVIMKTGKKMTDDRVGQLFGLKGKTAGNRMKDIGNFKMKEVWKYDDRVRLTNEEILAWFGR